MILLIGNTQGTLERNIIEPMRRIWGNTLVGNMSASGKITLFGRECYAIGADKSAQVSRLQGSGAVYCYGDEITTWSEAVFQMLKSRLDKPNACFDGTCNPDSPSHWFHTFLQSNADIFSMRFTIDDNAFLTEDFVRNLKLEYSGTVYYDRFILGLWRASEGVIYRSFADKPERFTLDKIPEDIGFCTVGLDFGGNGSAHAMNLTGVRKGYKGIVTLDEWYSKAELSPYELEQCVCDRLEGWLKKYHIAEIFCDSAEQVLIRGIANECARRHLPIAVKNARKGKICDRIRFYCGLMGRGKYAVMKNCKHTIDAFSEAVWADDGSGIRLDNGSVNIDSLDAQEYSTETLMKSFIENGGI